LYQIDNITYSMAYTEVLEILKHLPAEDLAKIPLEEIEFLKEKCDKNYKYEIKADIPIEEQNISRKANAILIVYFKKYFATELQKQKLDIILKNNQLAIEEQKREKYGVDNLFQKRKIEEEKNNKQEYLEIIEYKPTIFKRILDRIKSFFKH